jgi:DNA-binding transcriptional LysR family regulator
VPDDAPLSLGALLRHPLVTDPKNTSPYGELGDLVLRANLMPSQIHTSASLATLVRMGIEGLGLCAISPAIVRSELKSGLLTVVPSEESPCDLTFTATHAKRPAGRFVADAARIAEEVARRWSAISADR